jgi:hypothetical protein
MEPTYLKKLPLSVPVRLLGYQAGHHLAETCRSRPAANHPTGRVSAEAQGVVVAVIVVLGCRVLPSAMMWWCTHYGSDTCHWLRRDSWCPQGG